MKNLTVSKILSLFLVMVLFFIISVVYFFKLDLILLVLPLMITFIFSIPFFLIKKIDFFSIWSFLFYLVIFGVLLRSIYTYIDFPSYNRIDQVFLLGQNKDFLLSSMFLILFGSICMTIGYLCTKAKIKLKHKIFNNDYWDENKFFKLTFSLIIISLISLLTFINLQGGLFSLESISRYRGLSTELSETSSLGYLRLGISLSGINIYLLSTWLKFYKKRKSFAKILWFVSFFIFLFFNLYVSQRGAIVFLFIQLIALSYYFNGLKVPKTKLTLGLITAGLFFQIMSSIRQDFTSAHNQDVSFSILKTLEPGILTTNLIDISKTAHIMDAIPNKIEYQYGYTLTTILFAWIPRQLWKNKPVSNVDNTIGMKVFGSQTFGSGGVPPGIFAELYWNFWIPGVMIGCFLLGILLKIIQLTFSSLNKNMIIIYVTVFMLFGVMLVGSSFTSVLIGLIINFIPLLLFLNFITKKNI